MSKFDTKILSMILDYSNKYDVEVCNKNERAIVASMAKSATLEASLSEKTKNEIKEMWKVVYDLRCYFGNKFIIHSYKPDYKEEHLCSSICISVLGYTSQERPMSMWVYEVRNKYEIEIGGGITDAGRVYYNQGEQRIMHHHYFDYEPRYESSQELIDAIKHTPYWKAYFERYPNILNAVWDDDFE